MANPKASESSWAVIQELLAAKQTAEENGDDTTTAAIETQITNLGYQ